MKKKNCFIYTDLFLDDLCAVEYLSLHYENAVYFVTLENEIKGSAYASCIVQSAADFEKTAKGFFSGTVTDFCSTGTVAPDADVFLLAPLTDFVKIIKQCPSVIGNKALMMGGIRPGPDGAENEWNASADVSAYRYTLEHMKNLRQVTRNECLRLYAENGYPFNCSFLPEYIKKMNAIGENVTCFDLQAVSVIF